MTGSRHLVRVAIMLLFCAGATFGQGQETESHRSLRRPGMDARGVQLRLELLQRLQEIARDRQKRGLPPLDMKKLSKEVKEKLNQVQQDDKRLRDQLNQAQQDRGRSNPPKGQPPRRQTDPQQPRSPASPSGSPRGSNRQPPQPGSDGKQQPVDINKLQKMLKDLQNRNTQPQGGGDPQNRNGNPNQEQNRSPQGNSQPNTNAPRNNGRNQWPQNPGGNNRTTGGNPSQRPLSQEDIDGFNIAEYLKRLEDLPPLPNSGRTKQSNNQTGKRPNQSGGSGRGSSASGRQPNGSPTKKKNPLTKNFVTKLWKRSTKAPEEARKKLEEQNRRSGSGQNQNGSNTLQPPDAKSSDKTSGPSPGNTTAPASKSGGKGIFSRAMRRTAEGMFDRIGEAMTNKKSNGSRSRQGNNGGRSSSGMFDSVKNVGKKTSDLFGSASQKINNLGGSGGGVSMPSGPDPSTFVPFLIVAAIVAGGWLILRKMGSSEPQLAVIGNTPVALPQTVNTRQDVIDAFHFIASQSPAVKGNWWTHSRVARALRKLMPTSGDAISDLKRVYETARYLPPDAKLSPEQIHAARDAIERCST